MSGPASEDAILLAKCLEFCQALSSQGQLFNISISTCSGYSFCLDTRSKTVNSQSQKKPLKAPEECQTERGVLGEEAADISNTGIRW